MDYFQGVVTEYLRADRSVFVNTEYLINLDQTGYLKDRHWYCDALALNFKERTVYLCEVTYSNTMQSLLGRLRSWARHWPDVCKAIETDSLLQSGWKYQPWIFIPEKCKDLVRDRLPGIVAASTMPLPTVTLLEDVMPWKYSSWDRRETALAKIFSAIDNADMGPAEVSDDSGGSGGLSRSSMVLSVSAEGGSLSVHRVDRDAGARYVVHLSENYDLDEIEAIDEVIGEVGSFSEALALMDGYAWSRLTVTGIAPELEAQVLAAVEEREGDDGAGRWKRRIASIRARSGAGSQRITRG